jgi:Putative Ig domain
VPYGASISVAGGEADYTWVLAAGSGPLPPGIVLSGSTTAVTSVAGTPTTAGSYTFTVQATDALSRVASQTLTMVVLPQDSCLLRGTFSFMVSGYRGGGPMTHAGSISVDASGNITGEQDYKDGHRTTTRETLTPLAAGSAPACINRQTNSGQITLNAPSGAILYNFSITPPDAAGNLNSARLQLIGSGADSASGELTRLDSNAVTAAPPIGNFAFGLITLANQEPYTVHYGSAGYLTTNAAGTITAGLTDSNSTPALTAAPLTGTLSAPDSSGRGTASLAAGGQNTSLVYYMINAGRMYLMDIGATVATPRSTGYMTAQVGDAADGSFDNGALASASAAVMSLFGGEGSAEPITVMDLGRLSNGNATAGTLDALLDSSSHDTDAAGITYSAQPYAIASNGRGTLSLSAAGVTRNFVLYLDGIADGYVVEQGSTAGSTGLLEAQYVPSGGSYSDTLPGLFVGGTQFAIVPGPIVLIPGVNISFGDLSSTYSNGLFAIDSTTGRGFGSLSQAGVASTAAVVYEISPTKFEILTFGTIQVDGTILWMIQQ